MEQQRNSQCNGHVPCCWANISLELLQVICSSLDNETLASCRAVCRQWRCGVGYYVDTVFIQLPTAAYSDISRLSQNSNESRECSFCAYQVQTLAKLCRGGAEQRTGNVAAIHNHCLPLPNQLQQDEQHQQGVISQPQQPHLGGHDHCIVHNTTLIAGLSAAHKRLAHSCPLHSCNTSETYGLQQQSWPSRTAAVHDDSAHCAASQRIEISHKVGPATAAAKLAAQAFPMAANWTMLLPCTVSKGLGQPRSEQACDDTQAFSELHQPNCTQAVPCVLCRGDDSHHAGFQQRQRCGAALNSSIQQLPNARVSAGAWQDGLAVTRQFQDVTSALQICMQPHLTSLNIVGDLPVGALVGCCDKDHNSNNSCRATEIVGQTGKQDMKSNCLSNDNSMNELNATSTDKDVPSTSAFDAGATNPSHDSSNGVTAQPHIQQDSGSGGVNMVCSSAQLGADSATPSGSNGLYSATMPSFDGRHKLSNHSSHRTSNTLRRDSRDDDSNTGAKGDSNDADNSGHNGRSIDGDGSAGQGGGSSRDADTFTELDLLSNCVVHRQGCTTDANVSQQPGMDVLHEHSHQTGLKLASTVTAAIDEQANSNGISSDSKSEQLSDQGNSMAVDKTSFMMQTQNLHDGLQAHQQASSHQLQSHQDAVRQSQAGATLQAASTPGINTSLQVLHPHVTHSHPWQSMISSLQCLRELRLLGFAQLPSAAMLTPLSTLPHLQLLDIRIARKAADLVTDVTAGLLSRTPAGQPQPAMSNMTCAHLDALQKLTNLTALHINMLSDITGSSLAKLHSLTKIKSLSLVDALEVGRVTCQDLQAFLCKLPQLQALSLGQGMLTIPLEGISHVGLTPGWGAGLLPSLNRLTYLGLQYITTVDEQLLARLPSLPNLVDLEVEAVDLSYGNMMQLLELCRHVTCLKRLSVGACVLYDAHMAAIGQLTQLRQLTLQQVDIRSRDLSGWTSLTGLTALTSFTFQEWNNPALSIGNLAVLTTDSINMLTSKWRSLVELVYIGKVHLTQQAQAAVASLPCLTHLAIIAPDGTTCMGVRKQQHTARTGTNPAATIPMPTSVLYVPTTLGADGRQVGRKANADAAELSDLDGNRTHTRVCGSSAGEHSAQLLADNGMQAGLSESHATIHVTHQTHRKPAWAMTRQGLNHHVRTTEKIESKSAMGGKAAAIQRRSAAAARPAPEEHSRAVMTGVTAGLPAQLEAPSKPPSRVRSNFNPSKMHIEDGAGGLQVQLLLPHAKLSSCNGYITQRGTSSQESDGSQRSEDSVNWDGGALHGEEDNKDEAVSDAT